MFSAAERTLRVAGVRKHVEVLACLASRRSGRWALRMYRADSRDTMVASAADVHDVLWLHVMDVWFWSAASSVVVHFLAVSYHTRRFC